LYFTVEDDTTQNAGRGPLSGIYHLSGNTLVEDVSYAGQKAPESINFIPASPCSLTIKGVQYGGFLSVYDTTNVGMLTPSTSQIDGVAFSDFSGNSGKAIVTFEYGANSGFSTGSSLLTYTPPTTTTDFANVERQLEGFNLVSCNVPPPPGGCPATQGFWHKGANWPTVLAPVNINGLPGLTYNVNKSITIGGVNYSQSQLLELMPSGSLHSGNYANSLSQLIAAILNIAAGAKHTAAGDNAIASDNAALTNNPLFCAPNVLCNLGASVTNTIQGNLTALDNYNSAVGLNCTEGAGLKTGKGKD